MKENTPPSSPGGSQELEPDEFDFGDVEEVIDLDDVDALSGDEEEEEDMEAEEEIIDMSSVVFSQHKGSVFVCCASIGSILATGGEDDLAYVWDANNGALQFTCNGHKDSVTCMEFSHDGTFLATGDMSGYIQVWKISTASKIWEFETGDLSWLSWHHGSHVLLAGTAEGDMWMWLVPQGNARTFPSYGSASQCGAFFPDGKRAISGYEDGSIRIFDMKTGEMKHQFSDALAHSSPVTSISVHKDNTLAISGSVDGTAKLYNTLNGKVIGTLNCDVAPDTDEKDDIDNTVESVSFCPTLPTIAVTSTLSGFVSIWDISSQIIRHTIVQGCGSSQLIWHPTEPIVFAACLDGVVRSYDVRTGELLKKYTGHRSSIFSIDVIKDGCGIITASDDGTSRVFKIGDN